MNAPRKNGLTTGWTIGKWQHAYRHQGMLPEQAFNDIDDVMAQADTAWITRTNSVNLREQLRALKQRRAAVNDDLTQLPLYGVPFAIKDNIDAAGWPTTAACPEFLYEAQENAVVVDRLVAAGAILIGKTNLDQFACGLVGTRSPYGEVPNTFDARYVSGGSSSGSASVVARGLVAFSLGTDTAGSGRVPAGFNNIVGLKPTKGWLSTRGVVPACRSLDCVSVFALTVDDARLVSDIAGGYDARDPYSRKPPQISADTADANDLDARNPALGALRLAIPDTLTFYGDVASEQSFERALLAFKAQGAEIVPIDYAPFAELAALLYAGPWVAERFHAIAQLLSTRPEVVDPTVRAIVERAGQYSAVDTFDAEYRRMTLTRVLQDALAPYDALLVPTSPTIYTREAMREDPIARNSHFGTYTNFTNLADMCALALPEGMRSDGLPSGITLIAPAWRDAHLARIGRTWQALRALRLGATGLPFETAVAPERPLPPGAAARSDGTHDVARSDAENASSQATIRVAVVGAHLSGMPLNHQLTGRQARFVETTRTAPHYRLYALADTTPPKPGLVRGDPDGHEGAAIEVELWDVPAPEFGSFVQEVASPLGIGTLLLQDGREVKGFICEPIALHQAREITAHGGWRNFLARTRSASSDAIA